MKEAIAVGTIDHLGDDLGEELADRFLYHFAVRRYALALLGEDDEWNGLPVLPSTPDLRHR